MNTDMRQETARQVALWAAFSAAGVLLYQSGVISSLLVHTASEIVSILVAAAVAMLAWNARRYLDNGVLRLLGAAYLFVGFLDLLHTLSINSIALFPSVDPSLGLKLWLAARALQAAALLAAPSYSTRRVSMNTALAAFGAAAAFLILVIFYYPPVRGHNLSSGEGAAASAVINLAVIAAMSLALLRFLRQQALFEKRVFTWLVGSIILTIAAELVVGITPRTEDISDLLGNFIRMAAYYMIYKAVIETGFTRPMEVLFSDLVRSRESLQHERDFIRGVLDTARAMILVMDADGRIVSFNRVLQQTTGNSPEDVEGHYIWESNVFPGGQDAVRKIFLERLSSRPSDNFEQPILSAAGELIEVTWTTGVQYNTSGAARFIIATGIDISARKKVENELRYLSSHDALTGLYNRAYFEAEMLRLAASDEFPVSVVVMDLDGLKHVNDTVGHIMGDKLIQRAAHILRTAFRAEDFIARTGGDEFAVLLPHTDAANASSGAARVVSVLSAYNEINPGQQLSLSLGFATCAAGYQLMEAFKQADAAMYAQKNSSRAAASG